MTNSRAWTRKMNETNTFCVPKCESKKKKIEEGSSKGQRSQLKELPAGQIWDNVYININRNNGL